MTNSHTLKILGAWWCLAVALNAYPVLGQDLDIKAATDGRCDYWLDMLRDNPGERVTITLNDQEPAEIKVLIDGARWRLVLLAGEDDLAIGCTFAEGKGVIAP